jgi:hypothetical protein
LLRIMLADIGAAEERAEQEFARALKKAQAGG